jgi:hypothetical protein
VLPLLLIRTFPGPTDALTVIPRVLPMIPGRPDALTVIPGPTDAPTVIPRAPETIPGPTKACALNF